MLKINNREITASDIVMATFCLNADASLIENEADAQELLDSLFGEEDFDAEEVTDEETFARAAAMLDFTEYNYPRHIYTFDCGYIALFDDYND